MSRTRLWTLISALAALVAVVVAAVIIWRLNTVHPRSHTDGIANLDQAGPRVERYAAETVAEIPGSPQLHEGLRGVNPCNDPADHAPSGTGELAVSYDVQFGQRPDGAAVIAHLRAFWLSKGYKILNEHRGADTATISIENPADGFTLGIIQGTTGDLALNITSPCLAPGNETPVP